MIPPSLAILEQRLRKRGTETEEKIQKRMKEAKEEMKQKQRYHHNVINDTVDQATSDLAAIIKHHV